ncbi:MAG: hypothetical protein ACRC20_16705 [Segniliparus sp.]|uniref:hypothetical protein n=1 Tax=Segniliparus sp. TaxID=2804064 RepID=UPI003F3E0395
MSTDDKDETTSAEDTAAEKTGEKSEDETVSARGPEITVRDASKKKPAGEDASASREEQRALSSFPWPLVAALAVVVALCGALVFGYLKYREAGQQLAQLHQTEADRSTAEKLAKDYAHKSLTYTYQDPEGFFKSVEEGVAPALKDKWTSGAELLTEIMRQAKVESSGEILAAEATPQPGGAYKVVVSTSQTTKNLQNPQPRVSPLILRVIVTKIGDTWQISEIGPESGSKPPLPGEQAPPGAALPPVAPTNPVPPMPANPGAAVPPVPRAR